MSETNEKYREQLSANICAERARAKMSQEEVAKQLGIDRANYSQYETNNVEIKALTLYRLSKILGCSISDFFVKLETTKRG